MELLKGLALEHEKRPVVCLAGAGGKTTLLYKLCGAFRQSGLKTAAFTTTHIMRPTETDGLACIIDDDVCVAQAQFEDGKIVLAGTESEDNKLCAPAADMLEFLFSCADAIVAEADGSHTLPLKFPNANEPCLVSRPCHLFVVVGLCAIGRPLSEVCHRWPLAMAACGISGQHSLVTPHMMALILHTGYGALSPTFILNQADDEAACALGKEVLRELAALGSAKCVILSLQREIIW